MRRLLGTLTAILTGLLVVAAPAGAAPAGPTGCADDPWQRFCFFPAPSSWTRIDGFDSCQWCRAAGDEGVRNGDWPEYHCSWISIGLDGAYFLHVPPED